MAITVTPTITIDGEVIAVHAGAVDTEPVAIHGLEIDWGRSEYHSAEASPSTLSLALADTSGEWAQRILQRRALGRKVEISWVGTPTTDGAAAIGPIIMFRGRISEAHAEPLDHYAKDGRRRWEISLKCADRTADLGNALVNDLEWPAASMLVRANQIRNLGLAGGSEIEEMYFWPGYVTARSAPIEEDGTSALELMGQFYASMGNDAWAYDPHTNVVRQAIRLSQPYTIHLGSFDDHLGAVTPVVSDIVVDDEVYPGVSLGGRALIGDPSVTADPASDINRLECSWEDYARDHAGHTTVIENVAPGDARRVMAWDSWLNNGIAIDPTLDNVWARVNEEGARPAHPEVTTIPSHDFTTGRLARWILQTWENTRPAYISGSLAYQWLMGDLPEYHPVVAPIGGTTTFDPVAGWSVSFRVHWIHNPLPPAPAVTWGGIEQIRVDSSTPSVPWWWSILGLPTPPPVEVGQPTPERYLTWGAPEEGAGYRFAESVTWADLRHVPETGATIIDHLE